MPESRRPVSPTFNLAAFERHLDDALGRRNELLSAEDITAYRLFDGLGDGVAGLSIDRYGPAAVVNVYDDARLEDGEVTHVCRAVRARLAASGLEAVYVKAFARDRSHLGGRAPAEARTAQPRIGVPQPPAFAVREYASSFEVRLYDGLSTGLFLDHREHRRALARRRPSRVLNLFAYTCAFAVPLVAAGSFVINVDVSSRYLAWGKRNLALNALDLSSAKFLRMDAREYLAYARRHPAERFDLVIVDPPTFGAADRRRGTKAWSVLQHLPALLTDATEILRPDGELFVASNARELAAPGALRRLVRDALGREPRWSTLPAWPADVSDRTRVSALGFGL